MKAINPIKFICFSNLRTFDSPDISHRLYLEMFKILKCFAPQAARKIVRYSIWQCVLTCEVLFGCVLHCPSFSPVPNYWSPSGLEGHSATNTVGVWFISPARSNGFGFSFSDEAASVAVHNLYFPTNFQLTYLPNLGELLASRLENGPTSFLSAVQFRVWCCLENKGERWENLSLPPWLTLVWSVFLVPSLNFGQDISRAALVLRFRRCSRVGYRLPLLSCFTKRWPYTPFAKGVSFLFWPAFAGSSDLKICNTCTCETFVVQIRCLV